MSGIYQFFCLINYPLWWLILKLRSRKGKEHRQRFVEKLGYGYKNRPKGDVIWVHALGLGETLSLTFFLERLSYRFKNKTILFTSSTLNSFVAINKLKMKKNIIHQFAPVDNYISLRRFLSHWKPCMALISEIDLWPLRAVETKKYGIPLILFNSRMNEKKKNDRKRIYKFFKETLECFDYIFLQDEDSKKYFEYFGVSEKSLRLCGSFKSAGTQLYQNKDLEKKLKLVFQGKLVWIAASLHEDEEIEILEAYKIAKKAIRNLILIIVPRNTDLYHITRDKCERYSNKVVLRQFDCQVPHKDTEILIVTTIGELGVWYKISKIAFIGNSLNYKSIKTGKNPFEAIQSNCLVVHGPKMLEPSYTDLVKLGISDVVDDRHKIAKAIIKYSSAESRRYKILKGKKFIFCNKTLIERFVNSIQLIYKNKGNKNFLLPL